MYWRRARLFPPRLIGLLFVIAGVGKAWDPGGLTPALLSLHVPAAAAPVVGWVIAVGEMFLGLVLLLGVGGRPTLAVTIGVLMAYCGVLTLFAAMQSPPRCQCVQFLSDYQSARRQLVTGIVRNLAFIAALALAWPRTPEFPGHHRTGREP